MLTYPLKVGWVVTYLSMPNHQNYDDYMLALVLTSLSSNNKSVGAIY